jgi:hypothetical protein
MTHPELSRLAQLCRNAKCAKCDGEGQRGYADSTCGGRGAGGQMFTTGMCLDCRGLGITLAYVKEVLDPTRVALLVSVAQAAEEWLDARCSSRGGGMYSDCEYGHIAGCAINLADDQLAAAIDALRGRAWK